MGRTSGSSGLDDAGRTVNSGLLDGQSASRSRLVSSRTRSAMIPRPETSYTDDFAADTDNPVQADQLLLSREDTRRCGSTASLALLHSLDDPVQPFFVANKISLTTAHLG